MMTEVFLKLLNMSIAASWLVLAVLLLRLVLKKTPKWITCVLWGIVALRLILPFHIESDLSLIPSAEVIPQNIVVSEEPAIHSGIPVVNNAINPMVAQQAIQEEGGLETGLFWLSVLWASGTAGMLIYGTVSYWLLYRKVRASIAFQKNVYLCDTIASPFVLGIIKPKIYIPSGMDESRLDYVLAHENAHIKRLDHWWKPLSFLLLCIYWFNPLMWVAHLLLCRDLEQACDEKVISVMNNAQKKGYSEALIACSVHRRMIMACPVAFGELSVKERIKGVLSYRKPTTWLISAAVIVCVVTAVCFLTDPKSCPHLYTGVITAQATCTQKGMENRTCALCQHSYTAPVDLCPHSYDDGIVTKAPTCIELGEKERTCTGCGAKKTEPVEMTPHIDGELIISIEPNCSQTGEVTTACTYCQAAYVVEILEPNDVHDFVETVITESTCTKNGEGIKTCTRCNHTEAVTYELAEHSFIDLSSIQATCSREGYSVESCTVCHYTVFTKTSDIVPCKYVEGSNGAYTYCIYCEMIGKWADWALTDPPRPQSGSSNVEFPIIWDVGAKP